MRDDIARRIAEMGATLSPELIAATQQLYAARHETEPYRDVTVERDASYGAHPRQRLDVFRPAGGGVARPVLVFVHGGGFVAGDKRVAGGPYYDNVGVWAVRHGCIGITITYRLAPEHRYPAGAADVGAAVRWAIESVAARGGDPARIVLLGQSAGATHAATYGARPAFHAAPGSGVRGLVLLSGVYDFTLGDVLPNALAYVGEAAHEATQASALPALAGAGIPLLFGVSEYDPPIFQAQAQALGAALFASDGHVGNLLYLPRHNHISQIAHLNASGTDDRLLSDRLVEFIHVTAGPLP
jgi:triacylglycerol lipase